MRSRIVVGSLVWSASLSMVSCGDADPPPREAAPIAASSDASASLAKANAAEARGDLPTALAHAEAAIAAGSGRDGVLTAAKLAIMLEQYDKAIAILQPWVEQDPADAIAQYDLGLAHQHRNDYNRARSGYIAALRADPSHAEARYNLAILCWRKGFTEEAAHHVAKFRQVHPDDARNAELTAMITTAAAPAITPPVTPPVNGEATDPSPATPGSDPVPAHPPASPEH